MAGSNKVCRICQLVPRRQQSVKVALGGVVCVSYTPTEIADLVRAAEYAMLPKS